jgi:hypothetical protein
MNRRSVLMGLIVAPAVVKITSIMPVKAFPLAPRPWKIVEWRYDDVTNTFYETWCRMPTGRELAYRVTTLHQFTTRKQVREMIENYTPEQIGMVNVNYQSLGDGVRQRWDGSLLLKG